jgi:hypothetical protein
MKSGRRRHRCPDTNLARKFENRLKKVKPLAAKGDSIPADIGKLLALRQATLKSARKDIFSTVASRLILKDPGTGVATAQFGANRAAGKPQRGGRRAG